MATADQIKKLVKAYSAHDDDKFKTIVLQIAAHEAKLGHSSIAQELKKEAEGIGKTSNLLKMPVQNKAMLGCTMPSVRISELIVSETVLEKINRILIEYRNRNKLYKSGLSNRRKILLEGPPGTGKTMTASIIASELDLPLYTVQVDKLVTKFMGETSARLRQIFESIASNTGGYLFDEFDAIGADRSMDNEVGEMRRILNSFLQFIETDCSDSIIIAATNNQKLLDKALFRRFDDVIHYNMPNEDQIRRLIDYRLDGYTDRMICTPEVVNAATGLSHAELSLVCDDAIKDSILYDKSITEESMIDLLAERHLIYQNREA